MVQGRVGLDRFSASNSSSSQHSSAESTQDSAQCSHVEALLTGLESGCTWATDIGAKTPQVPREFDDFLRLSRQEPSPFVVEQLYTPEAVDVPAKVRHVLSGGRCMHLKNAAIESFFRDLFFALRDAPNKTVNNHSTDVTLQPWDLSHAHIVRCDRGPHGETLAMVFHTKEFPKEYRHTSTSPVLPLNHPDMGGPLDPRVDSKVSVADANYHLRNYIYLLSTNTLYLLDPRAPGYPSYFLAREGCEFFTFPEWKLGRLVGDVNYIEGYPIMVAHRGAFTFAHAMCSAVETICEEDHSTEELFHASLTTQVAGLIQRSTFRDLKEFCFRGRRALEAERFMAESFALEVSAEDAYYHEVFVVRLAAKSGVLVQEVSEEILKRQTELDDAEKAQIASLTKDGVEVHHAVEALQATRSKNACVSAFRAKQLLEVVHVQYRSKENVALYGNSAHALPLAVVVCKELFYADSALEALVLSKEESLPLPAACKSVLQRKDAEVREKIRKEQLERQKQRESKDEAKM